jgi:hypothetical protein
LAFLGGVFWGFCWTFGVATGLLVPVTRAGAGTSIVDNFDSYSTGPLSAASGGLWRVWNGVANDAQVVLGGSSSPNAVLFDNTYGDVVSYTDQDLFAGGAATLSFDFFVTSGSQHMAAGLVLASGDPSSNGINYASEVATVIIGYGSTSSGVNVNLYGMNFGSFLSTL